MRLLCNQEEATDAVQESFIRVWKHMHQYDRKRKFTTWLYSIVTNTSLDRLRAIKRNRRIFFSGDEDLEIDEIQDELDLHEIQSNKELAGMIKILTQELPLKQRLIFTLRDLQDLSVEEVVEVVGVSIGSVKTNLHYARRRIRQRMAEKYHVGRLES